MLNVSAVQAFAEPCNPELDGYVDDIVKSWPTPGIAVVVVDMKRATQNIPACITTKGKRAVDSSTLVDADTLFRLNSLTKAMTATAVARLVDKGELQWSDTIKGALPSFELKDPWVTHHLTLEDVFSHRSGVEANDWMEDIEGLTMPDIIHRLRFLPQVHGFRTRYMYDNFMFSLGGIAASEGRGGWEAMMYDNLFEPLGMKNVVLNYPALIKRGEITACHECELDHAPRSLQALMPNVNMAAPHILHNGQLVTSHWRWSVGTPAGGAHASARDLVKYLELYATGGLVDDHRLLSEKQMKVLLTPQISMPHPYHKSSSTFMSEKDQRLWEYMPQAYALGWHLTRYQGYSLVSHRGASMGYQSMIGVLPELKFAFAIMINMEGGGSGLAKSLGHWIIDHRLSLSPIDWVEHEKDILIQNEKESAIAKLQNTTEKKYPTFNHPLDDYSGHYQHPAYGNLIVSEQGGNQLSIRQSAQRTGALTYIGDDTFELVWNSPRNNPWTVKFKRSDNDMVTSLILRDQAFTKNQE